MNTETTKAAIEAMNATNLTRRDVRAAEKALASWERKGTKTPAELAELRRFLDETRELVEKADAARRILRGAK